MDKLTFEEWFEREVVPTFAYTNDDPYRYEPVARRAWEASLENQWSGSNQMAWKR